VKLVTARVAVSLFAEELISFFPSTSNRRVIRLCIQTYFLDFIKSQLVGDGQFFLPGFNMPKGKRCHVCNACEIDIGENDDNPKQA
jgi:hypothetical protein